MQSQSALAMVNHESKLMLSVEVLEKTTLQNNQRYGFEVFWTGPNIVFPKNCILSLVDL